MWFAGAADEMDPEMECNICDHSKPFNIMICCQKPKLLRTKYKTKGGKNHLKSQLLIISLNTNNLCLCVSVYVDHMLKNKLEFWCTLIGGD